MNLTVDLGSASRFASFDEKTSTLSVIESKFQNNAEGIYTIKVTASYKDEFIDEAYSNNFFL